MKTKPVVRKKKIKNKVNLNQRFCVVVTQKKSNSWVEDLCACEKKSQLDQVYN